MLAAYPKNRSAGSSLAGSAWIDLVAPTDAEKAAFEQAFGLRVPTEGALAEIETTSRLRSERDALYMSLPLIAASPDGVWTIAATGFVLSKNVLMTVRFAQLPAFDEVTAELSAAEALEPAEAFTRILEKLVDQLEATANDLDSASRIVFREKGPSRPSRESAVLRRLMMRTGRTSERMSHSHYTLVCLERMAKFATDRGRDWIGAERITRLQTVSSDSRLSDSSWRA